MTKRRGLLASAALVVGSGCAELNPIAEQEPLPKLGPVRLSNADDVAHELSVRINREGVEVFSDTYQLDTDGTEGTSGGLATVECGVGAERARYRIEFETGEGGSASIEVDRGDGPALTILAEIDGDGEIVILSGANDYRSLCDDSTPTPE
jgi:hypothetical protein